MRKPFLGFNVLYLPHYLTLPPADFHPEMLADLEDELEKFLAITGFRGCAKSAFSSLALPLHAALEKPERYPFIIVFSDTTDQAVVNMANIRYELEENDLLKEDYGDVSDGISKQKEWTKTSLVTKSGVRIMARSRGQRIRGLRHREHRPSLVILDDPEELEKVQKKEYRDKTERWLRSELIPAIEESKARLIVIGNMLHTDSLMARLKNDPLFKHRDYPIREGGSETGKCTWIGKYPTEQALKEQEKKVGHIAWMREYQLKVVPPEGQEIKEEWIQYYDKIPEPYLDTETKETINPILRAGTGVDLAISKKETADFTTMVSGVVARAVLDENGRTNIYILPNPVNERLSFHETIGKMTTVSRAVGNYSMPTFYIEDVAYQRAAIEEAQRKGIPAIPMRVGTDKRARLRAAAVFVQDGTVLFPRKGAEDLLAQLLGFGIEDHDDLVDGFVHLVMGIRGDGLERPEVIQIL